MTNLLVAIASLQLVLAFGRNPQITPNRKIDDSIIIKTITAAPAFGVPLVLQDLTRRKLIDGANPRHGFTNTFTHLSYFPMLPFDW